MMKEMIMKLSAVLTGAFEPTGDGGFAMTRTTHKNGDIAAFGQKHQDKHNAILSGLQAIKGSVKTAGEAFVTPLAFPVLNMSVNPAFTIPDDCV